MVSSTKDRISYEHQFIPSTYLTQYVGVNITDAHTDTTRPFFNSTNETSLLDYTDRVTIIDQSPIVGERLRYLCLRTVTGFTISNVGSGYSGSPSVSISQPVDIVGGTRLTAYGPVKVRRNNHWIYNYHRLGAGYFIGHPSADSS